MTLSDLQQPKTIVFGLAGLLVVVGGVWGYSSWSGDEAPDPNALPAELSVEALKAQVDDPQKLRQTMRDTFRRDDLTEEQRTKLFQNMREVWQSSMDERVDEYFAANTEEEKNVVLDRQVDELQERAKGWEKRRKEWQKERAAREKERQASGNQTDSQDRRSAWRRNHSGGQTREQRKARSESRDPDKSAKRMAYFMALRNRASERGVEMFRGPHGGGH